MAIDSKNLLVWVKAMSRGQALPLDASEVYNSMAEAQNYASTSAIAYPGQTVKAMLEDGKYHSYTLQPSDAGYVLEEIGAIDESDLKQYVQVVDTLPESGQIEGVLYINNTDGYIWANSAWKKVFWDVSADVTAVGKRVDDVEDALDDKAPIANPVFTGVVKIGEDEVATQAYVDGIMNKMMAANPDVLTTGSYAELTVVDSGYTFRVADPGVYFGHKCETGDLIITMVGCEAVDGEWPSENFLVVQANIDGAVTSTADISTVGEIVVFDAVTGKIIKGSGVNIASLNDAIAKAHEHANATQLATYDKTQAELLETAQGAAESLVNDLEGRVNTALSDKADKATTLAGYGITDAYSKTEIDGTLQTITDNLNTKISAADVDTKISEAKTDTLEEAATAAAEALELRVGAIPEDTTIQAYIDTAVGSGGTASAQAIATAKQEAIDTSKTYTDTQLAASLAIIEF